MITTREAKKIIKNYHNVNNKINYQHKLDDALSPLKADEFEIGMLIIYGNNYKDIMAGEHISKYKFYSIRSKVITLLCMNLEREDIKDVLTIF